MVALVLYVSPMSRYSLMAKRNCDELLKRVDPRAVHFEVCDISEHPERGDDDGVYYTPVLVKRRPLPCTHVVGDLSNTHVLVDLLEACGVSVSR
jgi:hypothetical protein